VMYMSVELVWVSLFVDGAFWGLRKLLV